MSVSNRSTKKSIILLYIITALSVFAVYSTIKYNIKLNDIDEQLSDIKSNQNQIIEEVQNIKTHIDKTSNEYILTADLLLNQTHINENEIIPLLNQIFTHSKKYEIDPLLLYSILWNESRLRNNVNHKTVYIKKLQKQVTAIGMGGIVWDFWGKEIIKNTSLNSKNDLYIKEKNIEATAFVLNQVYNKPILKNAKNQTESALARFYGKYNYKYITNVTNKMNELKNWRS